MSGFLQAVGLISGVLGIVSFGQGVIPAESPPKGAKIQVKIGNPSGEDPGVGGDIAAAYAWDRENSYLGKSGGEKVDSGSVAELTIDQFETETQALYVGVSAKKNAVCVAWITMQQNDNSDDNEGAWSGDIGYECGQHWYEQIEKAGSINQGEENEEDYVPRCTWLDQDHTGDVPSASMKFKIDAYAGARVADTIENQAQCDYTSWGADNAPINGAPGSKRSLRPRDTWMEDVLVVSNYTQHRAENLCSSDTSWGPDFVGTDGYFCDMHTHTLLPLCTTLNVDGCVNIDDAGGAVTKRSIDGRKRQAEREFKSYNKINHWD